MEAKEIKIPYTLYDIFGYLLPGISIILFCFILLDAPAIVSLLQKELNDETIKQYIDSSAANVFLAVTQLNAIIFVISFLTSGYVLGHLISGMSSYILEHLIVENHLFFPTKNLFMIGPKKGLFKKYKKSYTAEFIEDYNIQYKKLFGDSFSDSQDIYNLSFEYVVQNCGQSHARINNFLNLYGFSRNLSFVFILLSLLSIILYINSNDKVYLYSLLILIVSALALFHNYLKLLRRNNDEIYRSFYAHRISTNSGLKSQNSGA